MTWDSDDESGGQTDATSLLLGETTDAETDISDLQRSTRGNYRSPSASEQDSDYRDDDEDALSEDGHNDDYDEDDYEEDDTGTTTDASGANGYSDGNRRRSKNADKRRYFTFRAYSQVAATASKLNADKSAAKHYPLDDDFWKHTVDEEDQKRFFSGVDGKTKFIVRRLAVLNAHNDSPFSVALHFNNAATRAESNIPKNNGVVLPTKGAAHLVLGPHQTLNADQDEKKAFVVYESDGSHAKQIDRASRRNKPLNFTQEQIDKEEGVTRGDNGVVSLSKDSPITPYVKLIVSRKDDIRVPKGSSKEERERILQNKKQLQWYKAPNNHITTTEAALLGAKTTMASELNEKDTKMSTVFSQTNAPLFRASDFHMEVQPAIADRWKPDDHEYSPLDRTDAARVHATLLIEARPV